MNISLCGPTALRVLRALRQGQLGPLSARRAPLNEPVPPSKRWTRASIKGALGHIACLADLLEGGTIDVAVPGKQSRIRCAGVRSTIFEASIRGKAFLDIGRGVQISSPELLFLEMAQTLDLPSLLLLGIELCGTYSLPPTSEGTVRYGIRPVTSSVRLRSFLQMTSNARGSSAVEEALEHLLDNAWSPMEAILATMTVLPIDRYGLDLGPIVLNRRIEPSEGAPTCKPSRVPDILIAGTNVGMNYDGDGHFGIEDLARSAHEACLHPESAALAGELLDAKRGLRERIVDDKRRDRDLRIMGYEVLPVTAEDLYRPEDFDVLVRQLIHLLERADSRRGRRAKAMVGRKAFVRRQHELLKSLLPGRDAVAARERLALLDAPTGPLADVLSIAADDEWISVPSFAESRSQG